MQLLEKLKSATQLVLEYGKIDVSTFWYYGVSVNSE